MKTSFLMKKFVVAVTAVLAMLMAGLPLGNAVAQATTSYTSQLTGAVVNTTGSWTIDMESTSVEGEFEVVAALGQYDGVLISWLPSGTDLVMGRDFMLGELDSIFDTVVPIDKGAYGSVSYSLDLASSEGIEFGVFSLFLGERPSGYVEYYLYMGPVMMFTDGFASAQQNVTVGGQQIFDGVDGAGLQAFLNQHAGEAGGTATEPDDNVVAGEEVDPNATEAPQPTVTSEPADSGQGDAYVNTLRGEVDYVQGSLDDFLANFAGLQGDNADAAVQEINRISEEWLGYGDRANAIVAPAGYEDIDTVYRTLATDVETLGTDWRQFVTVLQQQGNTDQAIDTFVTDMNTVQTDIDTLNGMLDARESVDAETPVPTEPAPTEVVEPTQPAPTEVVAPTEPAPTEVSTGTSSKGSGGILVGGNESETGKGGQSGQTGQSGDSGDYAGLGLVDDGDYVSPQTGVEITWDETWFFDDSYTDPITSDTSSGLDSVTISWATNPTATIFVTVGAADDAQPADFGSLWTSADFLAENAAPDAEILANESNRSGAVSVLMRDYLDDGTEIIIMRSATCGDTACESLVLTTMIALPDSFADAYTDARGGIDAGGSRLFSALSPRDVSTAIGE